MNTMKYPKDKLLEVISKNRIAHADAYKTACEGYLILAAEELREELRAIENSRIEGVSINLKKPESHLDDYDRIILMIQMTTAEEIELEEHDFDQYVMDNWAWKKTFQLSNTAYFSSVTK